MTEKIKSFLGEAKSFCTEKLFPSCMVVGAKAWKKTEPLLLKGRDVAVKTAEEVKDYTVKKTVQLCNYLAANPVTREDEKRLLGVWVAQTPAGNLDDLIFEETCEPVEGLYQKAMRLWKTLFGDNFFIFRRVKRRIRKNKKVSKRDIRALEEDEFLEALKLSLKADNVAFIEKTIKLRDFPKSFINEALCSGNVTIIKIVANRYPELSNFHWVLTRLAKAREFEICYKVLEHIEYLEKYYEPFIKVLIHKMDAWDYEGWQVLDYLLKEKKTTIDEVGKFFNSGSTWRSFKEWRTSRRSSTFLFICFVV